MVKVLHRRIWLPRIVELPLEEDLAHAMVLCVTESHKVIGRVVQAASQEGRCQFPAEGGCRR